MATPKSKSIYKAGFGLIPPYYAGRLGEIEVIEATLDEIKGGAGPMGYSPDPAIVLVGPRGVGKTVLLARAAKMANKRGIHFAEVNHDLLSGPQERIVSVVFRNGMLGRAFDQVKSLGLSFMGSGVTVGLNEAQVDLRSAMLAFLTKEPLLLILDEAHNCDPESLNLLFDVVQSCMKAELPLALIIAGTPGLVPYLRRCKATYVERSMLLRINTLSREEAKAALEVPARKKGRPMIPAALKLLLDWSDNYPFFVQMAGSHAWNASKKRSGKDITVDDANKGLADADEERFEFYDSRYDELRQWHLADHAHQVIGMLQSGDGKMKEVDVERGLMEINKGMDEDRAREVVKGLQELGFLWKKAGRIEPGISSMFDFLKSEHQVAHH